MIHHNVSVILTGDNDFIPSNLHLSGRVSEVPGYIGVTINNRVDMEEIFRYDILVMERPVFNITFKVPNWGVRTSHGGLRNDLNKTFDIHLEDAHKSYDIYLTHMLFEQQSLPIEPEKVTAFPNNPESSAMFFAIVGGVTLVCMLLLVVGYIYIDSTKAKVTFNANKVRNANIYADPRHPDSDSRRGSGGVGCATARSQLTSGQTCFVGFYIAFRVVYNFVFTFTVFFAVLSMFIQQDLGQLGHLGKFQSQKYNDTLEVARRIDAYSKEELLRQSSLVTSMQGACSNYIGELFESMTKQMENVTAQQHLLDLYNKQSSVSFLMHQRADNLLSKFQDQVNLYATDYRRLVNATVKPSLTRFKKYLQGIFHNNWFQFPQKLSNQSQDLRERLKGEEFGSSFEGNAVDFGMFLDIEEVTDVVLWEIQFWER